MDITRTPDLSAVATALQVNIVDLVRNNLGPSSAVPVVSMPQNASGSDCGVQPNCVDPVPAEGCLASVVVPPYHEGICILTRLQPNLSLPLADGTLLKVCNIPAATWKGADDRLSGTAAPGGRHALSS